MQNLDASVVFGRDASDALPPYARETRLRSAVQPLEVAPRPGNICGCVVTYNPDAPFPEQFRGLMAALPKWIIIDNASCGDVVERLDKTLAERVELIRNPENLGVATALNQAARRAKDLGFDWLMTFDQDSRPEPYIVEELLEAYEACAERGPVGMLGSNFWPDGLDRAFFPTIDPRAKAIEWPTIITAGSLLSLRAYSVAGPFCDELFIDGVDTEYCLRLRSLGFRIAATCKPLMRHGLGRLRPHRFLWKRPAITHHSPLRRYYIVRNSITIARRYRERDPAWSRFVWKVLAKNFLGVLLFEEQKVRKVAAFGVAAIDAFRGRMGKATRPWLSP